MQKNKAEDVLYLFEYRIKTKIIRDKEVYLLHELLKNVKHLSEENYLETLVIEHTSSVTLIWAGFSGFRFEVGRGWGVKLTPTPKTC